MWRFVRTKAGHSQYNALCSYSTAGMRCGRSPVVMRLPPTYYSRTNPSEQVIEGWRMFYHEA